MEPISIKLPLLSHGLNPFSYQNEEKILYKCMFLSYHIHIPNIASKSFGYGCVCEPNSACNLQPACLDIQILNYLDFGITNVNIKNNVLSKLQ